MSKRPSLADVANKVARFSMRKSSMKQSSLALPCNASTSSLDFEGVSTEDDVVSRQTTFAATLRGGVFGNMDVEQMTNQAREQMAVPDYCVTNFYHKTGFCQAVARHPMFEVCTLAIIAINSVWLAYDIDANEAALLVDSSPLFIFADNFFCFYFVSEWLIRYGAFEVKAHCLRDFWCVFDGVLCAVMVFETWLMSLLFL